MYKFTNKIILGVLGLLFLNNLAFGIDSEYKNSLVKVELKKASEGLYSVDLYTKTKYQEPVKVIKKSDLNYYILLPETKNETVRTTSSGTEIRSVSTKLFQYAGENVNNGYVKIDISTTKPMNFKVNVRDINVLQTLQAQDKVAKTEVNEAVETIQTIEQVEKKNSDFSNFKKAKPIKETLKEKITSPKKELPKITIEDVVKQEVDKVRQEQIQRLEEIEKQSAEFIDDDFQNEEILSKEDIEEIEKIAKDSKKRDTTPIFLAKFETLKDKIFKTSALYGIDLGNFILSGVVILLVLLFLFVLLFAKKPALKKCSSTSNLNEKENKKPKIVSKKQEVKNDGQYFVFDKNIKQTGFCDPATTAIKRNYELSSYEPELKNKYSRSNNQTFAKHVSKRPDSEYDIIQKILKEDTFIDIPSNGFVQVPKVPQKQEEVQQPKKEEEIKEIIKEESTAEQIEPTVLSSVEIAPQRGFMCVSYKDTIRLLGYIFDDVFALYNFKAPRLQSYDIKYRLSEKDDKSAHFIVKVDSTKMLVKVTKSAMDMEVLL